MDNESLNGWLTRLALDFREQHHRCTIILSGSSQWCYQQAGQVIDHLDITSTLQVSEQIEHALSAKKARTQLGKEVDAVVFDACHDFDPDALAAIAGTIRGGGFLLLLLPVIDEADPGESRFLKRLFALSQQQDGVYLLTENTATLPGPVQARHVTSTCQDIPQPYKTVDQQRVVNTIIDHARQSPTQPVVLTSDRGRGKSSSLGFAAAMLVKQGARNIIVTAPRLATSEPLFRHAQQLLQLEETSKGELLLAGTGRIRFMAPDALLAEKPPADIVLVDEAAAIPLPLLMTLAREYPAIVFSSTIHGYEGTGRGFAVKFKHYLSENFPGWLALEMTQPVRWAENDPLEQWLDKVLCLSAEPATLSDNFVPSIEGYTVSRVERDRLANDEDFLSNLFALLVFAHYRTQPSDLKHLLDDPGVRIYIIEDQQQLLGVILVNQEGGFDRDISSAVYRGERRPAGHLLAQTLTFHAGCESAATCHYARVMRIVIHPQCQGRGLGRYFLEQVCEQEQQNGMDAIGSSFAASAQLIHFWERAGFKLVRMGFTRDHVSGLHSAVCLNAFSDQGRKVLDESRYRFQANLADWQQELLGDLDSDMQAILKPEQLAPSSELNGRDWQDIDSFVSSHRGYEACISSIRKLVVNYHALISELTSQQQCLVEQRVTQRHNWKTTAQACGYTGKAEATRAMKQVIGEIGKMISRC